MENTNPVEEVKVETPVATPEVKDVTPEPAKAAEPKAPEVKAAPEAPKAPDAISTDSFARSTVEAPAVGAVANGAIGVTTAPKKAEAPEPKKPKVSADKVAIRSSKNVSWGEVGKVSKGINIVTKEEADQWLTRDHIELVKPEEVAKEFGL